jgi:hypothetical protein
MLPIIVAGSRPAATLLAQRRHFDCDTSVDPPRWLHVNITETGQSRPSSSSTVRLDPIGSHRPHHAQQPNHHKARGTASRIPSRDFLLWRFSNAGLKPRSSPSRPSRAGIRKPSQNPKKANYSRWLAPMFLNPVFDYATAFEKDFWFSSSA